jgi:PAS domain S-box-containing protein
MQINDIFNEVNTGKVITWSALSTAVILLWKRIVKFFKFFYRAYIAVEKIEKLEQTISEIHPSRLEDKLDQLAQVILDLRNDMCRMHQIQVLFTNTEEYGYFYCDLEGNNLEINRKYCKELGTSFEDLKGRNWIAYVDSSEEYDKIWEKAFKERRNFETRISFVTAEGKRVGATVKNYLVRDINGPCGYAGFIYFD